MKRWVGFFFAVGSYGAYLGFYAWFVLALTGLFPTWSLDAPRSGTTQSTGLALLLNLGLILLFSSHHSLLARMFAKRWLKQWFPPQLERSLYVLCSSLALGVLLWAWQPMPQTLWSFSGVGYWTLLGGSALGWGIAALSTFQIDHFEMFGLRQGWDYAQQRETEPSTFTLTWLYRVCRHPMMLGMLLAFWLTPVMTAGRLLLVVTFSLYIVVGIQWEERGLEAELGEEYEAYKKKVPQLLPFPRP